MRCGVGGRKGLAGLRDDVGTSTVQYSTVQHSTVQARGKNYVGVCSKNAKMPKKNATDNNGRIKNLGEVVLERREKGRKERRGGRRLCGW